MSSDCITVYAMKLVKTIHSHDFAIAEYSVQQHKLIVLTITK